MSLVYKFIIILFFFGGCKPNIPIETFIAIDIITADLSGRIDLADSVAIEYANLMALELNKSKFGIFKTIDKSDYQILIVFEVKNLNKFLRGRNVVLANDKIKNINFKNQLLLLKPFYFTPILNWDDLENKILELRSYSMLNYRDLFRKIEMFVKGDEFKIFKTAGIDTHFFGETVFGKNLPELKYMVSYNNLQEREILWKLFFDDPLWIELTDNPIYQNLVDSVKSDFFEAIYISN